MDTEQIKRELSIAVDKMEESYQYTINGFSKLRVGKAMPSMLDGVKVEYYGSLVPVSQVASVNNIDARTLIIKPWDKGVLKNIEEGIAKSYLKVTPQNDGDVIHINIPPLTEEGRTEMMKQVKAEAEKGKVHLRHIRKDVKDALKKLQKEGASEDLIRDGEVDLQKDLDKFIKKIDELTSVKEKEIMML